MRRLVTTTGVTAMAIAATLTGAVTPAFAGALATGGGCASASSGGTTIQACISATGGGAVTGDYYVTAKSSSCTSVNTYINYNGSLFPFGSNSCALGHHVVGTLNIGSGHAFTHIVGVSGPTADSLVVNG